ncbi:MAG: hypothetical protein FJZ95_09150 [Chloroflexi bacterium]|nr:hypothetical protein [Chloroflexota bacterium]
MIHSDLSRYTREDLLNVARASPLAVAKHDKQAWLALFSANAVVEDPVGTAPHRRTPGNSAPIDRFYETFIAPNDIVFRETQTIVVGNCVIRDVTIEVKSRTGLTTNVHMYLLYELTEEAGQLKIGRLAAHWELKSMVRQVLSRGWPGFKMMNAQSIGMLRYQGLGGVWGYMKGFSGIGHRGKEAVRRFVDAANSRDSGAIADLLDAGCPGIEFPVGGRPLALSAFLGASGGRLSVSDPISSGYVTGFRFRVESDAGVRQGIGLMEFSRKTRKIARAQFFWE